MPTLFRLLAACLALASTSCANQAAKDRTTKCALEQLPKYRACLQRVASEARQCEEGYRFRARLWCQKKHSTRAVSHEEIVANAYICTDRPLDSPECKRSVERLLESQCPGRVWEGVEDWKQPEQYAACRTGIDCCVAPSTKASGDCDQAAANAVRQCGGSDEKK